MFLLMNEPQEDLLIGIHLRAATKTLLVFIYQKLRFEIGILRTPKLLPL